MFPSFKLIHQKTCSYLLFQPKLSINFYYAAQVRRRPWATQTEDVASGHKLGPSFTVRKTAPLRAYILLSQSLWIRVLSTPYFIFLHPVSSPLVIIHSNSAQGYGVCIKLLALPFITYSPVPPAVNNDPM